MGGRSADHSTPTCPVETIALRPEAEPVRQPDKTFATAPAAASPDRTAPSM